MGVGVIRIEAQTGRVLVDGLGFPVLLAVEVAQVVESVGEAGIGREGEGVATDRLVDLPAPHEQHAEVSEGGRERRHLSNQRAVAGFGRVELAGLMQADGLSECGFEPGWDLGVRHGISSAVATRFQRVGIDSSDANVTR